MELKLMSMYQKLLEHLTMSLDEVLFPYRQMRTFLPGTTMDIYCSGIVALLNRQVNIVVVIRPVTDFILFIKAQL